MRVGMRHPWIAGSGFEVREELTRDARPAAPCVAGKSTSQAPDLLILAAGSYADDQTAITVSAVAIAATSQLWLSRHLRSFAMWTAFPSSDYYDRSVAMGLAACRRSRVRASRTF
jgi:hypothetical protein